MKITTTLGDMFMSAAYAPSGRATCKGCQAKINKEELRLSNILDDDHYHQEHHFHADCFQLKPAFKNATYKDIFHVENLSKEDQEKVKAILEKLQKSQIKKKPQQKKVNPKSKQSKPKKSDIEDDSDSDDDYKGDKIQKDKKQSKTLKEKKVEVSKLSEISQNKSDEEQPDVFVLYDDAQKEEFKKIQLELEKKSAGQLKQMLKANDQKQTGNKGELIERIADCMIKGCLEKCPNCSGGRPKLNPIQKVFKCPGYMDDTEFRYCNKVYGPKDLKRIPWVDI
ncbi:unnamed protein product [Paramecium primaurelia]|uniref:NAD(+) ADP-ribosyltransferase n=1 Tax=Paramecium primaurelia TaxID=5886 RepID=A0A8S1KU41_PARPR|nr:unnamed protein product [Paramecium primaurelia]